MNLDSDSIKRHIEESRSRAAELAGGLTAEQLIQRPEPSQWSIAECIAHLNATANTVQGLVAEGVERGKREKILGTGPFDIGTKGRFLVWFAEPPPKVKITAPRRVQPPAKIDQPLQVFEGFMAVQDGWERLLRESAGLDLARIKVGPRLSAFRVRLAAVWPWMMAHQRRHLLQAEKVREAVLSQSAMLKNAASS